jgi:glycosyltransferase involved in cell wall biosynthesis
MAQKTGAANKRLRQNWLSPEDTVNILRLSGFEVIQRRREFICPFPIPLLARFCNRVLVRFWPFYHIALANFYVAARNDTVRCNRKHAPKVSVVVPSRNEAGNISHLFERIPEMGAGTELLFVEGGSTDTTYQEIERCLKRYAHRNASLLRQDGTGKGAAVRTGFSVATGDILMILDADMTVAPEDLPRFYEALIRNRGEFINGVRLVYPMEHRAMRFCNYLGNKFFSLAFSKLLGQPLKDTLCGTKVLWKQDYEKIAHNRRYFGDFDPFGDFDLLLGAAKLNLKIVDMPVRYRERTYGETNIRRWHHGAILFKMLTFAARKILFV